MKFEKTMSFYDSNRIGDILFIFHNNHKKYLNDELSKYNMSQIHALCILMIHENEELNQKDLSDGLYLTKSAITKAVKKLEEEGWILREKSVKDKRHFILKLTDKGSNFIPIMNCINKKWESEMGLDELNPDFMQTFNKLTHRAIDLNLKKEK